MREIAMLILSSFSLVVIAEHHQCGKYQQQYYHAFNHALRETVFKTNMARSHVTCARDCYMLSACVSINYHKESHLCELNNSTRIQHTEEFTEVHGSVYFDSNKDTTLFSAHHYSSCKHLLESGSKVSGEYTIFPHGFENGLKVFCDMENDGGGWIVIQRRQDGTVDFYRDWQTYQAGFGNLSGEFWIGNDNLLKLTKFTGWWKLRVDLTDWENNTAWLEYGEFGVYDDSYTLY